MSMGMQFNHHKKVEPILKEIISRLKPDLIVVDAYICSPSITNSGIPWVFIFSTGPLLVLYDPEKMPPPASGNNFYHQIIINNVHFAGLSINDDKKKWKEHENKLAEVNSKLFHQLNDWVIEQG